MSHLQKPRSLFWYLIPLALGLHGLVLSIPIDHDKPAETKTQSVSIKRVPLATLPKPSPVKSPGATPKPSPQAPAVKRTPLAAQRPAPARSPVQSSVQSPVRSPAPRPKPTPAPPVAPTPIPTPDAFQIQGAIACEGIKDCYASAETNGRQVSETLEQQLQAKGYTLQPVELDEDTGMKIYQLFQNGQARDYLHIIWTDQGTRHLRLLQPITNRQELAAVARLSTQDL